MLFNTLLLALPALATAAHLLPRQTVLPACASELDAVATNFPQLPKVLMGMTENETNPVTDICSFTPPATLASALSAFQTSVVSWYEVNWPKLESVVSKCPEASAELALASQAMSAYVCSPTIGGGAVASATTTAAGTGAGAADPTTGGGNVQASGTTRTTGGARAQSTTKSGSGAARETGFVAGVVAAVGLIGALVAL